MKKFILIALALVALVSVYSCGKAKRCICFEVRSDYPHDTCRGIEALGSDGSCEAKNSERMATDSANMIVKWCRDE